MRLIDADKLKGKAFADPDDGEHFVYCQDIDEAPTVDAVPVVRGRECRYYAASGATTSFCIHPGGMKFTSDSDYCSRGKRRAIWDNSQLKQQEHPIESTPLNQEERWLKTV